MNHRFRELQKSLNEKNEQIRASQSAYHREHSRLESLRNMTERYDGYGNSIRSVLWITAVMKKGC